jgi:class 3 adenylate cyclase/tetratricopeptide (TPR) repeat protein
MSKPASALVAILFTDLVGSAEPSADAGDEEAQRIARIHHDLLAEAAASHGGAEVKWLGGGLMVSFPSATEALRAAIAVQQAAHQPVQGERLSIRIGLNSGEPLRDAADYFGTHVMVARRLCERARIGQILCSDLVSGALAGQPGFVFSDLGPLELKGVPKPVVAYEVRYEAVAGEGGLTTQLPLVGRDTELGRLSGRLAEAAAGGGGLAMILGEPGIGKTRLMDELSEQAWRDGAFVLRGGCFEAEWSPPFAPFAEALGAHVATARPEELRADMGPGAAPIAQLVPAVREALPDVGEPPPLQPDEERFRLLDSVASFLLARSRRAPLVVCLDDLQWADKGTVAMLRHVARLAPRGRVLVVGAYRDGEVEKTQALVDALGALRREVEYDRVKLEGLDPRGVSALLSALGGGQEVEDKIGRAWARETEGNPLFVRELLTHLVEEGHVYRDDKGRWASDRPLRELGVPEEVREVMGRRLARLSETARKFLGAACAFEGSFEFDVVLVVADLDEDDALDAVDEALAAQVLQSAGGTESYVFTNGLLRQSLYAEVSPTRQARLHRKVAEALEANYGDNPTPAQMGEIASQYHRSRGRGGAERGVAPALVAAAHAEANGAHEEAARFLQMALDLCPDGDARRLRILGRLGMALTWALRFDEAVAVATEAAEAIAAAEGPEAAANFLSEVAYACAMAGSWPHAWALAPKGLDYAGTKRDVAWARLLMFDHQRREAEDTEYPGIPLDTPERAEAAGLLRAARLDPMGPAPMEAVFASRDEALSSANILVLGYWYGDLAGALPLLMAEVEKALAKGQLARAARTQAFVSFTQAGLGRFDEMRDAMEQTEALAARLGMPVPSILQAKETIALATDEGLEELAGAVTPLTAKVIPALAWLQGGFYAWITRIAARLGQTDEALRCLGLLAPWLERAPAWTVGFPLIASHAAEALWVLERLDHVELIEGALREKVVAPDFRSPMVDGRLALARLCALTGRHDEAASWFSKAREVLTEQGARPLLAIVDYDEALMYARRNEPGDAETARPLLEAARSQFESIGMNGWIRRADELAAQLKERLG